MRSFTDRNRGEPAVEFLIPTRLKGRQTNTREGRSHLIRKSVLAILLQRVEEHPQPRHLRNTNRLMSVEAVWPDSALIG